MTAEGIQNVKKIRIETAATTPSRTPHSARPVVYTAKPQSSIHALPSARRAVPPNAPQSV